MLNSLNFFSLTQLAEAAYADFADPELSPKEALIDKDVDGKNQGFSDTQADLFLADWQIVSGAHRPNTDSGYSSTLFQDRHDPTRFVLAFRGTEGLISYDLWSEDIGNIATDGIAIDQIVDLYNEWQRITRSTYNAAYLETLWTETALYQLALVGQAVTYGLLELTDDAYLALLRSRTDIIIDESTGLVRTVKFEDSASAGLGLKIDSGKLTVTGHSLGGHLAVAFTRLFPEMGAEAFTVNGAGFATGEISVPGVGLFSSTNIRNLFSMLDESGGPYSGDKFEADILNLYGDRYPEVVTQNGSLGLYQQGGHEAIYIEHVDLLDSVLGHGGRGMTDSLAVYDLFFAMNGGLQAMPLDDALARLKPIFGAASSDDGPGELLFPAPNSSLENLVNALADVFGTGVKISVEQTDQREALYLAIYAIRDSVLYDQSLGLLTIQPLTGLNREQLVAKAQPDSAEGLAYRYAIANLIPFAISGDSALYTQHNATGELDLYDPATGTGALTERYLRDRAAMLTWQMQFNTDDIQPEGNTFYKFQGGTPYYFRDMGTDTRISIGGGYRMDMLQPLSAFRHVVFGSENDDLIFGQGKADWLYGSTGADTLTGNGGNDYLEGGAGVDSYLINPGDGHDTVLDSDGQGAINLGALLAKGSATTGLDPAKWRQSGDVWQDQQNAITYTRIVHEGETRLLIKRGDASVLVRGWTDGQLGIELGAGAGVAAPVIATSFHLQGDLQPIVPHAASGYDSYGNAFVTGDAAPDRADVLYDHETDDRLQGHGGNDLLIARYGGHDLLEGGAGFDFLMGGIGNDQLFGEAQIDDLAAYLLAAETQAGTGERGDWLSGWDGNDILVGGAGNDALVGGKGEDLVIAGAGNDLVYGDFEHTFTPNPDGSTTYFMPGQLATEGAADVIYGNAGDDVLLGGGGSDKLYGDGNGTLPEDEGNELEMERQMAVRKMNAKLTPLISLIAQAKGSAGIDPKQVPPTAERGTRIRSQNAIAVCRPSAVNDSEWRFAA